MSGGSGIDGAGDCSSLSVNDAFDLGRDHCRALAARWRALSCFDAARTSWPGPIAHEIEALANTLDQGDSGAAILQWTDTAETLIKFFTLCIGAELIATVALPGSAEPATADWVRRRLLQPRLSGGAWSGLLGDFAEKSSRVSAAHGGPAMPLASVIAGPKASVWRNRLQGFNALRNAHVGHSAFAANPLERVVILRNILFGDAPARAAAECGLNDFRLDVAANPTTALAAWLADIHAAGTFAGLGLELVQGDDRRGLDGAASVRDLHRDTHPGGHAIVGAHVLLRRGTEALHLNPWIAAEVCSRCRHQDVFFFDSLSDETPPGRFDLLDYPQGHKMRRRGGDVAALSAQLTQVAARLEPPDTIGGPAFSADVMRLLDKAAFDQRYVTPVWLKSAVEGFIANRTKGVLWIQAPRDVGKTIFAQAIADRGLWRDDGSGQTHLEPLFVARRGELPTREVAVAGVFIRHTYRFDPSWIAGRLLDELFTALAIPTELKNEAACRLDIKAGTPVEEATAEMVRFLGWYADTARRRGGRFPAGGLVIVIDGLDELRGEDFARYLPPPDALPVGVYLVLLSRRTDRVSLPTPQPDAAAIDLYADERDVAEAVPWLATLEARLTAAGMKGEDIVRVALDHPEYLAALTGYIDRQLAQNAPLRAALTDDTLTRLLEASLYRFKYLAFFVDLLEQGAITPNALAGIGRAEEAVRGYLEALPVAIGSPKIADLAIDILVALAAFERAHQWYFSDEVRDTAVGRQLWDQLGMDDLAPVSREWRGVPLDLVARLLDRNLPIADAGSPPYEPRFLFALLRLKPLVSIWRATDGRGESQYQLWYKGLGDVVAGVYGPRLAPVHAQIAALSVETAAQWVAEVGNELCAEVGDGQNR